MLTIILMGNLLGPGYHTKARRPVPAAAAYFRPNAWYDSSRRGFWAVLISLAIHVCVSEFARTGPVKIAPAFRKARANDFGPIPLRLVTKQTAKSQEMGANHKQDRKKSRPRATAVAAPGSDTAMAPPPSYASLLPTPGELVPDDRAALETSYGQSPKSRKLTPEEAATAGGIAGKIQLPYVMTAAVDFGRAVMKIRRTGPRSWQILSIDGTPRLRAVLFATFTKRAALDSLAHLSARTDPFTILLAYETKPLFAGYAREEEVLRIGSDRLEIHRTRYVRANVVARSAASALGSALSYTPPDRDVERAERHDAFAFTELLESPAYIHPIRGHDLHF